DARRQLKRPLRSDRRPFLRDGRQRRACDARGGEAQDSKTDDSRRPTGDVRLTTHLAPPSGLRSIEVRLAGTRYFFAACCTSAAVTFSSSPRVVLRRFGSSS